MKWKKISPYCLLSDCSRYTITRSMVSGQPVYQLFRGKERLHVARGADGAAECKALAK